MVQDQGGRWPAAFVDSVGAVRLEAQRQAQEGCTKARAMLLGGGFVLNDGIKAAELY